MIDVKPCPCCKSKAVVATRLTELFEIEAKIECLDCGITFVRSASNGINAIRLCADAWNAHYRHMKMLDFMRLYDLVDKWDGRLFSVETIPSYEPERTCHNVYGKGANSDEDRCKDGFRCSECGANVEDFEGYSLHMRGKWNYCPNCKAKVV